MAFYESIGMEGILLPVNEAPYVGDEKTKRIKGGIKLFYDAYGSFRFVLYRNKIAVSGLQLMQNASKQNVIANVFTLDNERCKGLAKELYFKAKEFLKAPIFHSTNLSELGRIYANKVN